MINPSSPPPTSRCTPTSAARLHRLNHSAVSPTRPPPSAPPATSPIVRRERNVASATERPAPTPAPPAAPHAAPTTASTGATAIEAVLVGAAASIRPPKAPPSAPATPPPRAAPAHRVAATRAARRNRRVVRYHTVAAGDGAPITGTSPASGASQRASRNNARA